MAAASNANSVQARERSTLYADERPPPAGENHGRDLALLNWDEDDPRRDAAP
jgi:hypothetical protein